MSKGMVRKWVMSLEVSHIDKVMMHYKEQKAQATAFWSVFVHGNAQPHTICITTALHTIRSPSLQSRLVSQQFLFVLASEDFYVQKSDELNGNVQQWFKLWAAKFFEATTGAKIRQLSQCA